MNGQYKEQSLRRVTSMSEGIVSLQKSRLIPRALHFLHENYEMSPSEMISHGMNRRTLESSLDKMSEIGLVGFKEHSTFPRFGRTYHLTEKGVRIIPFLTHLEDQLRLCSEGEIECISRLPKGCLEILVHKLHNPNHGVTRVRRELEMSPSQIYVCLDFMIEKEIILREKRRASNRVASSYRLSKRGTDVAIAAHALNGILIGR
jgi:DNA-binding MarR family transcriptional regulator